MGFPRDPQDAAPAYEDVFHEQHPVNQHPPSGSTSAYTSIPQDDVELGQQHNHTSASPAPPQSLLQIADGVNSPKPHVHCEQCDVQTAARERRANERHCCTMVAITFMIGIVCVFLVAIIVPSLVKHR